jgi:hypothetical protein
MVISSPETTAGREEAGLRRPGLQPIEEERGMVVGDLDRGLRAVGPEPDREPAEQTRADALGDEGVDPTIVPLLDAASDAAEIPLNDIVDAAHQLLAMRGREGGEQSVGAHRSGGRGVAVEEEPPKPDFLIHDIAPGRDLVDRSLVECVRAAHAVEEQLLLVAEVPVDSRARDLRQRRDLLDRGAREAVPVESGHGRPKNVVSPLLR